MEDDWAGCPCWSEAHEQAFIDRWALRILACPRASCRRQRSCTIPADRKDACPPLVADPFTAEEKAELVARARFALKRSLRERADGTFPAKRAARARLMARRAALAFARAKAAMRKRARGAGRERRE